MNPFQAFQPTGKENNLTE